MRDTDRTHWRGEPHNWSKLTEDQVREIKVMLAAGRHAKEIGAAYGVHAATINHIRQGRSWAWLT